MRLHFLLNDRKVTIERDGAELPRLAPRPAGAEVVAGGTDLFSRGGPRLADGELWFIEGWEGWGGVYDVSG